MILEGISNPNLIWSAILVDELARAGLRSVCIAPGSRSTPLTLAFDAHPSITVYRHLDERSAAFFALGLALETGLPAALLCTSGTAAANFMPAIIEARHSQVPMLVLTADRPPELRHSGANQTIDQVKMYGDQVLWSVDLDLPQVNAPAAAVRNLRTLAARAFARANGLEKGPVHLNIPFRKPLEPAADELGAWQRVIASMSASSSALPEPFTRISHGALTATAAQLAELQEMIDAAPRGLIVCGPRCPGGDFPAAVAALSRASGYPIFADPLSGVRFGPHLADAAVIGGYDTFLMGDGADWESPAVVIRFGHVPTSKSLNDYLDRIQPRHRVHINQDGGWADDAHRISYLLQADPVSVCAALADRLQPRGLTEWAAQLQAKESACWGAMDTALSGDYFDGVVMADVVAHSPAGTRLFAGNSLSVRHLDQFGRPSLKRLRPFANRGASGIDGNVSTALGIGAAGSAPLVAVMGDITFYHDMNGLLAIKQLGLKVTIVLLNNDGGGIFRRLPVARIEPPFTELFITPHGLDFGPAAQLYSLHHFRVEDRAGFQEAFAASLDGPGSWLIEVKSDGVQDHSRRQELLAAVALALKSKD